SLRRSRTGSAAVDTRGAGSGGPFMSKPRVETIQSGDKATGRYRSGKRVKRLLLSKRPPSEAVEQLINYRTEPRVACHLAAERAAPADIQTFPRGEYHWTVRELAVRAPGVLKSLGYPARYWKHSER